MLQDNLPGVENFVVSCWGSRN